METIVSLVSAHPEIVKQETINLCIPLSWRLLQSVKRAAKPTNILRGIFVSKMFRLFYEVFSSKFSIQNRSYDIHLMQL